MSDCQVDLNYTNLVPSAFNNVYRKIFPLGSFPLKNNSAGISNLAIPNSIFNVTSATTMNRFNNNFFQYIWIDNVTYDVVLPDGIYEVSDINAFLINTFISNGHYLLDSNSNYVVYLQLQVNPTAYAITLNAFPVPDTLPTGWSNPASLVLPGSPTTPQLVVPSTNKFGLLIGFNGGTYPSTQQSTNYSIDSQIAPQINPISVIYVLCNLVNNPLEIPCTIIYSFDFNGVPAGTVFKPNINVVRFVPVFRSQFTEVEISFVDQDFNPIYINDTRISIGVYIKNNDPLSETFISQ
jgi:hypothetical protein